MTAAGENLPQKLALLGRDGPHVVVVHDLGEGEQCAMQSPAAKIDRGNDLLRLSVAGGVGREVLVVPGHRIPPAVSPFEQAVGRRAAAPRVVRQACYCRFTAPGSRGLTSALVPTP